MLLYKFQSYERRHNSTTNSYVSTVFHITNPTAKLMNTLYIQVLLCAYLYLLNTVNNDNSFAIPKNSNHQIFTSFQIRKCKNWYSRSSKGLVIMTKITVMQEQKNEDSAYDWPVSSCSQWPVTITTYKNSQMQRSTLPPHHVLAHTKNQHHKI